MIACPELIGANLPGFPRELLKASDAEKLDYFHKSFIAHPVMDEAKSLIKSIISYPGDTSVIFVYGPTGAGKTALMELITHEINEEFRSILEVNRGMIAAAHTEVALEQSGVFSSKGHLERVLLALEEPEELLDCKIKYSVKGIGRNNDGELVIDPRIVEHKLGLAVENALKYRRLKIFCLDEAHHMLSYSSGKKVATIPETIKSIANRSKTVHGLFGTYDLLTLHDVGDQLSRRSAYIHLRRYHADSEQDWLNFQSLVLSFLLEMPLEETPDLLPHCPFLYQRSLGCAGTLKSWFKKTLAYVYSNGAGTLTLKDLEQRALSRAQCQNILRKIKEGEAKHQELEAQTAELDKELGLDICSSFPSPQPNSTQSQSDDAEPTDKKTTKESPKRRGRKAVGMPNPTRYPVGVE